MPREKAGDLFMHILEYVNDMDPTTDDLIIQLTFEPVKQQLKRDLEAWENELDKKSSGGKIGNLKRWHKDIYKQVIRGKISLEDAVKMADNSKISHTDTIQSDTEHIPSVPIGSVAVTVNVNDTVINNTVLDFDSFWDLYDKKVGDKTKLKTKFNTISEKDRQQMLVHIPAYKIAQPDKAFRKDPATYLNNKSWNDEIIVKGVTTEPRNPNAGNIKAASRGLI